MRLPRSRTVKSIGGAVCVLMMATAAVFSETLFERELERLRSDYEKAVAAALAPIKRRHQADLETLLHRATRANDIDAATKIKRVLDEVIISPEDRLSAVVTAGPWEWYTTVDWTGTSYHVRFCHDGRCEIAPGKQFLTKWEPLGDDGLKVYHENGRYYIFDLDMNKRRGKIDIDESTQKEPKSIRFIEGP